MSGEDVDHVCSVSKIAKYMQISKVEKKCGLPKHTASLINQLKLLSSTTAYTETEFGFQVNVFTVLNNKCGCDSLD